MKLVEVRGDDWEGWYVDGDCKWQHHSIQIDQFIDLINKEFGLDIEVETVYAHYQWLDERGNLPDKLDEVIVESTGMPYGKTSMPSQFDLYT